MKSTLENMNQDENGKALLAKLKLDGFGDYPDSLFDGIRANLKAIQRITPDVLAVTN